MSNPKTDKKNISWLEGADKADIADFLLHIYKRSELKDSSFNELQLGSRVDYGIQLQNLYKQLDSTAQRKFQAATMQSLAGWLPEIHGKEVLLELAELVRNIRATRAIAHFRDLLREDSRLRGLKNDDKRICKGRIISVLACFAPLEDIKIIFDELFLLDSFADFAATLFLGLCICQPKNYPQYVHRFLELHQRFPGKYPAAPFVMSEFERYISLPTIVRYFKEIKKSDWKPFLEMLCHDDSSVIISHKDENILLVSQSREDQSTYVLACETSIHYEALSKKYLEMKVERVDAQGATDSVSNSLKKLLSKIQL